MTTLLADVAGASEQVARTGSRIAKRDAIAACLVRTTTADDVAIAVAYLMGEIRQGRIGIGWAALAALHQEAATTAVLTLGEVDAALAAVAVAKGKGAAAARQAGLQALFARATAAEQSFLQRLLLGELRQGALQGVMVEAVAAAAGLRLADVRRAAMNAGSLVAVARAALTGHLPGHPDHPPAADTVPTALAHFAIELQRPVQPMLAQPADSIADALAKLANPGNGSAVALEWKIDGARVQVHKSGDTVGIYTRSLNDVTASVPEIVAAVRALPAHDLILDGEAVALRPDGGPQPFQVTMRRFGRKLDVERLRAELPLAVFFFDCLLHGGTPLADRPGHERWAALADAVPAPLTVPRLITAELSAAQDFYADALARGHEGVMVKTLDAPYQAGSRGAGWLKVKRAHTLDLVVLAAEWGNGRRRGWLSNLHLGARADGPDAGFVMLGKTFKGMTDALLEWQTRELLAREVRREGHAVVVRPELVVEVAFNDLQQSPHYPGGLALRFARIKGYRSDKTAAEADTITTVRQLYAAQGAGTVDG